ncbi:hypothetical protein ABZ897_61805 [Nonomuraea sp. NPDC046802]|uniref:hypothetical protein n=1 Tax=Nonomuraea sp. NPDC046802 TaxID=3154919 RepID=UPI0033E7B648
MACRGHVTASGPTIARELVNPCTLSPDTALFLLYAEPDDDPKHDSTSSGDRLITTEYRAVACSNSTPEDPFSSETTISAN